MAAPQSFWRCWLFTLLVLPACAGGAAVQPEMMNYPDWRGPAVHGKHLLDRGFEVELVAPTGGHEFELVDVTRSADGRRAEVRCRHKKPVADFVTQVITPHRQTIAAARLGDTSTVSVFVQTGSEPMRLALCTARP
jgi:hypothetical protein